MNKSLLGIPVSLLILVILIVLPLILGLILASERATRGINRLESDLEVVEDTQVQLLQLIATPSATPTVTPTVLPTKYRPATVSGELN